ncbi:MAG: addiction module antitoxin RelB [Betaproteobacteria bacterium]|nr:MAG: addiction module antitoxin RelB [Betaproteobacteria bacterium]
MMATTLDELERQVRALSASDKAALAHLLIEELDASADADADRAWIEEAQRRYDAFIAGELSAIPGDGVMSRARTRLK